MNTNEQEINLFNIQQIASALFIVTILISMYTTNQTINDLKYNMETNNDDLNNFNRYLALALLIVFFFTNYYFLQLTKVNKKDPRPFQYQLLASILAIVAAILVLYGSNSSNSIASSENPTI